VSPAAKKGNGATEEPFEPPVKAPEFLSRNDPAPEPANSNAGATTMLPDRIGSRDDVVKCLDLVITFYDRTEPSSPIPHLARRVRRMVHMDFMELMEDLAPSGLKEFRLLAGVPDMKKPAQKDER
jgi:type VI secretion system protein ImpA